MYEAGKTQNPPIAIATASALLSLAWSAHRGGGRNQAILYASAAIFTLAVVPFTLLIMAGTNQKLDDQATRGGDGSGAVKAGSAEEGIDFLLARWRNLNAMRSLLPFVGGVLGTVAALM